MILDNIKLDQNIENNELIEKEFFKDKIYKKIKKLIYEIILARIEEILEIILFKNNNFSYYNNFTKLIFFDLKGHSSNQNLKGFYEIAFSNAGNSQLKFVEDIFLTKKY